ncbi:hypothetical protein Q7O56_00630 [Pseudomonas protegens]|uniref:Uncharacterized protein n=1 Tax=Pseudomonas idahonensis TaxID=2942628 RepID=A0ABT5PXX3_9PSED|nr:MULTISPECIES: hypothetical protein [Pseudomonas]MDD1146768.1 hypothetical protein [Pseudomonas idahonensis]MDP9501481.1 hypothetical protein [Pseudomonas protegens]MDP9507525.1 hypothetical protein [Pseudomonas protegens]
MSDSLASFGPSSFDVATRRTQEAMADVDCARVIDHQQVVAWAASLSQPCPLPKPLPQKAKSP